MNYNIQFDLFHIIILTNLVFTDTVSTILKWIGNSKIQILKIRLKINMSVKLYIIVYVLFSKHSSKTFWTRSNVNDKKQEQLKK